MTALSPEEEALLKSLTQQERAILPSLAEISRFSELKAKFHEKFQEVELRRALQWLENKGIITTEKQLQIMVSLGKNGKLYAEKGLPEVRFLQAFKGKKGTFSLQEVQQQAQLEKQEINILIGLGKQLGLFTFEKGTLTLHPESFDQAERLSAQKILEKLQTPQPLTSFNELEQHQLQELKKRKDIVIFKEDKDMLINLTALGKKLLKEKTLLEQSFADHLTPAMLKDGTWKNQPLRWYDIASPVPMIHGGKRHFVNQAIEYIRRIWLELGFEEMTGNYLQTAFWDLDALFVPQDHPARTMQDTFYLEDPAEGELPQALAKVIKAIHENGGNTGSRGWQYQWSEQEAKQLLLRTHTTVLSAQTLLKLREQGKKEGKFFSVGKVFRNETLDWKHLFEFYQVEGIVVSKEGNLSQLKGFLKDFYAKMGYKDVRMRPAHFPYTEPSLEIEALHHNGKWIELGGAGIFRPEVTKALLGEEIPVLAWGLGMARIISSYFDITDIRELYKNDIKQLRTMKLWLL